MYDLAIRIAYEHDPDDIAACLSRIASNPDTGKPFTRDEVEQLLKNGFIRILPKIKAVDPSEIAEVARAVEAVLRAL